MTSGATPAPTPSAHGSGTPPPFPPFSPTPRPNRFLCRSIDRFIRARPLFARGVRKMERALPPATLREKLPRFLQKCAQEFQDDLRYRDDPRYLRVWIQLVTHPPTPIAATTRLGPLPRPLFTADPMHHKFMVGLLSKKETILLGFSSFCRWTTWRMRSHCSRRWRGIELALRELHFIWLMHYIMRSTRGSMTRRRCTIWGSTSKQSSYLVHSYFRLSPIQSSANKIIIIIIV